MRRRAIATDSYYSERFSRFEEECRRVGHLLALHVETGTIEADALPRALLEDLAKISTLKAELSSWRKAHGYSA
jgi:hypothetical protein